MPLQTYVDSCKNSQAVYPAYDHKGQKWFNHNCGEGGGYSHIMPPNQQACFFANEGTEAGRTLIGASSPAQIRENVAALSNLAFTEEELRAIDRHAAEGHVNLWEKPSTDQRP